MLRSIFSLIHNIIDSDKEYNNKISTAVCCLTNSENNYNVDLEINGKPRESLTMIRKQVESDAANSFSVTTDQGDALTCNQYTDNSVGGKSRRRVSKDEKHNKEYADVEENAGDRASFYNEEEQKDEKFAEIQGDVGISIRELLATLPQKKTTAPPEKDKEQLSALLEQIQKMKKGMERLHQIAKQFSYSDKFKQDVDYLIKNLSGNKRESKQKKLQSAKP